MHILLLSRGRTLYSTRRLAEACRRRGHALRIVDPFTCTLDVQAGATQLLVEGEPMTQVDCVIPRIAAVSSDMIIGILKHLEARGSMCLNGSVGVVQSRDKFRSMQVLADEGLPIPRTLMVRAPSLVESAIEALGGPPVIIKLREGTQGVGVVKADSVSSTQSMIQALWSMNQSLLLQEFIAESKGSDVRAFVVDGRVVAAMERSSQGGDFRSNLHLGGRAQRLKLDAETRELATRAAAAFGLSVAGVDLLISHRGPLVTEVNASPGLEGIEGVTGVDVAKAIVRSAEARFEARDKEQEAIDEAEESDTQDLE